MDLGPIESHTEKVTTQTEMDTNDDVTDEHGIDDDVSNVEENTAPSSADVS